MWRSEAVMVRSVSAMQGKARYVAQRQSGFVVLRCSEAVCGMIWQLWHS